MRADVAFAKLEIYEALERGVKYAIRMPANDSLEQRKSFYGVANRRDGVCYGAVSEIQKEILAWTTLELGGSAYDNVYN